MYWHSGCTHRLPEDGGVQALDLGHGLLITTYRQVTVNHGRLCAPTNALPNDRPPLAAAQPGEGSVRLRPLRLSLNPNQHRRDGPNHAGSLQYHRRRLVPVG